MSEDAAAGAGMAEGDAPAGTAPAAGAVPAATFTAPATGAADQGAEDMLADAVNAGADNGNGPDLAAQLKQTQDDLAKWKAASRKTEADAKKNALRLAEFEDAQKTEAQRLADRASAAEQRAAEAEGRYHRTLAAATYGLSPSLIDMLGGSTEDEINASAESLAAEINSRVAEQLAAQAAAAAAANGAANGSASTASAAAAAARARRPVESMRAGAAPAAADGPLTGGNFLHEMYRDLKQQ